MSRKQITVDGNEAVASVAYRCNEVVGIYPITPSSPMSEQCDVWASQARLNAWGQTPKVVEMQSEAGAVGTVHGSLQAGALTTTFTSSQGLLLKIPNLYKIAGELTAFCMHVAARTVATHALSIFCDHSDVMACRQTGMALVSSGGVQEAHDFALIGQSAAFKSRIPVMHFFDGFRTSHEVNKIEYVEDETIRALMPDELIEAHRNRALTPDRPLLRGTAQNPDVFFQAREACNPYYDCFPEHLQAAMDEFAEHTGRQYKLYDYYGHPEAEEVVMLMGSSNAPVEEAVDHLLQMGRKVGLMRIRLFRPFAVEHFLDALPASTQRIAVLDRTKEPGAAAEPLFQEILTALFEDQSRAQPKFDKLPLMIGGRYGLSSKEFDPACALAVFKELAQPEPKRRFTVGIEDDVTGLSLNVEQGEIKESDSRLRALFYGLGADGTVSANKSTIKIVGELTERQAQGYFVYDSKKSGAMTVSHLRFDDKPINSSYLLHDAQFVACHHFPFTEKIDMLEFAQHGATLLLNAPFSAEHVWDKLPKEMQQAIIDKDITVYTINASAIARECGIAGRINTIMQTCFFALTDLFPVSDAIGAIKAAIEKNYGKRGPVIVEKNCMAVDRAIEGLVKLERPASVTSLFQRPPIVSEHAPDFVKRVSAVMLADKGNSLPVSAFTPDGTWPTATAKWEKRNIADMIPVWQPDICTQCNQCVIVCPHAAIRTKVATDEALEAAPETFKSVKFRAREFKGQQYLLQVAPEDCTGCSLCVEVCPAKDKGNPKVKAINMVEQAPLRAAERDNYAFFLGLPEVDRTALSKLDARSSQVLEPLFEYSGACSGCGETPYVKLLSQLFGDRLMIANATGCSSIYGGNLPTTPFTVDSAGRGPTWCNSLFEDNAEFGLGYRMALEAHRSRMYNLLEKHRDTLAGKVDIDMLLAGDQQDDAALAQLRGEIDTLKSALGSTESEQELANGADYLVDKSVWCVGGDGWAYDIGFGGLDHVLSLTQNINILVMDTQSYSNTGGQMSKATPLGATAKFAASGKPVSRKDLGLEVMMLGHVYVAQISLGASYNQTVKAFKEAEAYPGPSIIIAYSPCIAHGFDMAQSVEHQKMLVESGMWPLFRYDPRRAVLGKPPMQMDSKRFNRGVEEIMNSEARFKVIAKESPEKFKQFVEQMQQQADRNISLYKQLSDIAIPVEEKEEA